MVPYDAPLWIVLPWLFVLGTVIGSFLNVCIHRIPLKNSFWASLRGLGNPPSRCPRCFHRIQIRDNIPVLGWIKLGGKCRACRNPISARYPLIEFFNGLLFVLVYWLEVPSGFGANMTQSVLSTSFGPQVNPAADWLSPMMIVNLRFVYHMILLEALLVASFIDFDLTIIPDGVTLPTMFVGVVGAFAIGQVYLVPLWFQEPSVMRSVELLLPSGMQGFLDGPRIPRWIANWPHLHGLLVSLAGLVVGGGIVWVVRVIGHHVLRQEAMGFGDVVLMAMIGSFLGWQPTVIVFFMAPVLALGFVVVSSVVRRFHEIPYGPYLSLATLLVIVGWKQVWGVSERIFSMGVLLIPMAILMAVMLFATLMVVQGIKRLLGIAPVGDDELLEEWTSADQLSFFAGEHFDRQQGLWPSEDWPGNASGTGTADVERWKAGTSDSQQQGW